MGYFKRLITSWSVSLEAFKMYYVMRASAPSLHRESTDSLINGAMYITIVVHQLCIYSMIQFVLSCSSIIVLGVQYITVCAVNTPLYRCSTPSVIQISC